MATTQSKSTKSTRAARPKDVPEGQRFCGRCQTVKAADQFPIARSGAYEGKPVGWCKACRKEHAASKPKAAPKAAPAPKATASKPKAAGRKAPKADKPKGGSRKPRARTAPALAVVPDAPEAAQIDPAAVAAAEGEAQA